MKETALGRARQFRDAVGAASVDDLAVFVEAAVRQVAAVVANPEAVHVPLTLGQAHPACAQGIALMEKGRAYHVGVVFEVSLRVLGVLEAASRGKAGLPPQHARRLVFLADALNMAQRVARAKVDYRDFVARTVFIDGAADPADSGDQLARYNAPVDSTALMTGLKARMDAGAVPTAFDSFPSLAAISAAGAGPATSDWREWVGLVEDGGDGGGGGGDGDDDRPKPRPEHQLVTYLLTCAVEFGMRHDGRDMFLPVHTPDGFPTFSFVRAASLEEFMMRVSRSDSPINFARKALMKSKNADIICWMTQEEQADGAFAPVTRDRNCFSFDTGVLDVQNMTFSVHMGSGGVSVAPPADNASVAKYHPHPFDARWMRDTTDPLTDIPTPAIDSILETQGIVGLHRQQVYGLMGRLLFNIREHDSWGLHVFFLGRAGTGKSVLAKIMMAIYETEDVAIFSDNVEKTFGFGKLEGRFVAVCSEVTKKFQMNQALFQNWATRDPVSLAVKREAPKDIEVEAPLFLAGNDAPRNYTDNGGDSVTRRMATVHFDTAVDVKDGGLEARCLAEIPAFIAKIARIYRTMAEADGQRDFWSFCCKEFTRDQEHLKSLLSPAMKFLHDDEMVTYGPDMSVNIRALNTAFRAYCRENNFDKVAGVTPLTEFLGLPDFRRRGVAITKTHYRGVSLRVETDNPSAAARTDTGGVPLATSGGGGGGGLPTAASKAAPVPYTAFPAPGSGGTVGGNVSGGGGGVADGPMRDALDAFVQSIGQWRSDLTQVVFHQRFRDYLGTAAAAAAFPGLDMATLPSKKAAFTYARVQATARAGVGVASPASSSPPPLESLYAHV